MRIRTNFVMFASSTYQCDPAVKVCSAGVVDLANGTPTKKRLYIFASNYVRYMEKVT